MSSSAGQQQGVDAMRQRSEAANRTAEEFIDIYYNKMDTNRTTLEKLYLANATASWNGNSLSTATTIQKFVTDRLPPSSHELSSFDAQPVNDEAVGQTTVLIQVAGFVKYNKRKARPFQQNFLITAQDSKWKIVTDTFRSQE